MFSIAAMLLVQLGAPVRVDSALAIGSPGAQDDIALAARDGGFLLAWTDTRRSEAWPDVYALAIGADGGRSSSGGVAITADVGMQIEPTVACGPNPCALAYNERYGEIRAVRL